VLFCGALPLVVGVSIFVLWVLTRWDGLMIAGLATVCVGLVLFAMGVIALAAACLEAARAPEAPGRRAWLVVFGGGGLLLSNFLVAGAILVAVSRIESCYTVVVRNATAAELTHVRVAGAGSGSSFGTLAPGESARRWLWFRGEGILELRATGGAGERTHIVDGYVGVFGGRAEVTLNADGTATVDHRR
jgi:hypothetical protein